jgi:hypothetical protein
MFDQLFKAQRARERHLNAPLVDERIRLFLSLGCARKHKEFSSSESAGPADDHKVPGSRGSW